MEAPWNSYKRSSGAETSKAAPSRDLRFRVRPASYCPLQPCWPRWAEALRASHFCILPLAPSHTNMPDTPHSRLPPRPTFE